ncbi:MAG: pyrroline-5-carboxylate reductase [Gammaproteobacteria bacterium]|nr:pyrroline-5-carboxylate reductase [Gammaproteobacteria bacterium]
MENALIAIIGAGHMGMSLLGGLISNGCRINQLILADPDAAKLQKAKNNYKVHVTTNNMEAIKTATVILFAVKPDIISVIAEELAAIIQKNKPLVISIAAGIRETSLQHFLNNEIPIVRAMPNMPALIGCGATALYANSFTSQEQRQLAESILKSVGIVVWLENESLMDAVTALSGSGPAYFYLMIEAMQAAGEKLGLPAEIARILTLQTAYGASCLARESETPASALRQQAMTPGGTTEQAVRVLEENNIREIIASAVKAAANRAHALGL